MTFLFRQILASRQHNLGSKVPIPIETRPTRTKVTKDLKVAYMFALMIVAGLSIVTHILLDEILKQNISSATVINVAGRQRMLSQRIGLFTKAYANGDESAKEELVELTDLMEQSHQALIIRNGDFGITGQLSDEAAKIYFHPPYHVDRRTRRFINHVRALISTPERSNPQTTLRKIRLASMSKLLDPLDRAVEQYEIEATERLVSLRRVQRLVLIILLITLGLEARLIFRPLVLKVQHATQLLLTMAMRDELTGLLNRRAFVELSEREISLAKREEKTLTLLIADLDRFKSINDTYGHAVGDEVIKKFAQVTTTELRQTDIVARIGGEEFAIVLVNSNLSDSMAVAERLRTAIESAQISSHPDLKWTSSIGLTELSKENSELVSLMNQADQALYTAKENGRNQIAIAPTTQVSINPKPNFLKA